MTAANEANTVNKEVLSDWTGLIFFCRGELQTLSDNTCLLEFKAPIQNE